MGGWSEFQFAERPLPTLDELNQAAPDTPVFVLHLYDRALLNRAAMRAVGYTRESPNPPAGEIARDAGGNPTGILIGRPNALILYATLAKGPKLPSDYRANSSRHFMRELNRLGITSVIDAGGGFQNYPEAYQVIDQLHNEPLRLSEDPPCPAHLFARRDQRACSRRHEASIIRLVAAQNVLQR